MNATRLLLSLALAAGCGAIWAVMRRLEQRWGGASHGRGDGAGHGREAAAPRAGASSALAIVSVLRASSGFLGVLFLLKAVPALSPPRGLLRDDFLFPLWALWRTASAWWWFAPALACGAAIIGLWWRGAGEKEGAEGGRGESVDPEKRQDALFLAGAILLACLLFVSLALTNEGYPDGLVAPFQRSADYQSDVGRFGSFREIWSGYAEAQPTLSVHGRTHPPGAVALLWLLGRATGGRLPLVCLAVVLIGALTLIPLHRWARRLLTPAESRTACLIWIFTPAVTLYGATCMDMVFGLVLLMPLASFTAVALGDGGGASEGRGRTLALGVLLGVELAAGLLVTFSAAVLALALAVVAASRVIRRDHRGTEVALATGIAAAVSLGILLALRPIAGFDWLECLRAAARLDAQEANAFLSAGYYLTTRLMDVLDFLVLAGIASSPLWLGALGGGVPARGGPLRDTRERDALILALGRTTVLVLGAFFLLGAYKIGETGRIFLFLMPLVAVTAARRVAGDRAALGAILAVQFLQTLLMQGFLDTRW